MDRQRLSDLWARGQRGWPVGAPVVQFPNVPLLVAFAAIVVGWLTTGPAHATARAVFFVALAIWAYEELVRGANGFRRVFGAAGLLYAVVRVAQAFGA